MTQGFERVQEITIGELAAADRSTLRGQALLPIWRCRELAAAKAAASRLPLARRCPRASTTRTPLHAHRDVRRRVPHQLRLRPAGQRLSRRSASWPPAAATPRRSTSPAARRRSTSPRTARSAWSASRSAPTPRCPTARRISSTVLQHGGHATTSTDAGERAEDAASSLPEIEKQTRERMRADNARQRHAAAADHSRSDQRVVDGFSAEAKSAVLRRSSTRCRWRIRRPTRSSPRPRRKAPGARRHLLDLRLAISARAARPASPRAAITRRCGWCRKPRKSTPSTKPAPRSSTCCPTRRRSTSASTTTRSPQDSKTATLRNMLMVRRNYDALVSGDGACAGCGEKSVLALHRRGHRGLHAAPSTTRRPIAS